VALKGQVFTGARAVLLIQGKKVGYCTNCNGGEQVQYEDVDVLDNIEVEEQVPVKYRARFAAGFVQLVSEDAKSLGHFALLGANAADHLRNILTTGDLTIQIQDNQTNKIVALFEQAKGASNNFTINAVGVVARDMEFVGIRIRSLGDQGT
jgi:hypothetical protein